MMKKRYKKIIRIGGSVFTFLLLATLFVYLKTHYEYYAYSPYDVIISDVTPDSATISWKTDSRVPSYILFNNEFLGSGEYEKFHRIQLENLQPDFDYTFLISNGKRTWSETSKENTSTLEPFIAKEFEFNTKELNYNIYLPVEQVLTVQPDELTYAVVYDQESGEYSEIKSTYANKFGGVVFDKAAFEDINPLTSELVSINYFNTSSSTISKSSVPLISSIYAASTMNCNQNIPDQKSNAISREAYSDLANRWVGNRGKNYAYECYNDVVYRAKRAGVDPAFVLTLWLKESSASNYTLNPKIAHTVEDFGIHKKKNVPTRDFDKQINYFLTLRHSPQCPGQTKWEAWGNIYRTGYCNTNDPGRRQVGIEYYKDVERIYRWITNGRRLPKSVTGYKPIAPIEQELEPKCCALKVENSDSFVGKYHDLTNGRTCEQLWLPSTNVLSSKLQYPVLMETKTNRSSCETEYEGVCCNLGNAIQWYPKEICEEQIPSIANSNSCNQYIGEKACYFRDAKYMWLPKVIGDDFEEGISLEHTCMERNREESFQLKLYQGINFVGFDFTPLYHSRELLASELLEMYPEILLIANFVEYEWQDIIVKTDTIPFAGNDFVFVQNKGYLITVTDDITVSLDGWKNSTLGYENTNGGWLLVGGNLYTSSGWASKLIADLKSNQIPVKTVAIWSNDVGYFNYRREDGEEVYGEDVPLEDTKGIFIKAF